MLDLDWRLEKRLRELYGEKVNADYWEENFKYEYGWSDEFEQRILDEFDITILD